ncbi:DUF2306 domain-containing protein [Cognatiyoonia sp. IB215446]|uniref:DUF2306 domain-containing protein n=1 Tax=Cognatiyoonia sp. IB215446 TaxID=3097355 RepID=UPI002A102B7A|nr:DUF2306 domain-containing protein [Cognatiyoonia sp. IB215446]MDX8347075.1 DUF2306 domain-containing protein [Cognatiyoonia sp. IB215446]
MTRSTLFHTILCIVLALLVLPFGFYALDFGQGGLRDALPEPHYLMSDNLTANLGIFVHMIAGALVTCLVPFQLVRPLRNRFLGLHRWSGRVIGSAAILTAIGSLIYIPLRGTIGGWPMDAGFTLYGALTLIAALQTIRFARARQFARHRNWALRFFWLAIGSWLYRVHYGLWYLATDGLWSNPDFTGAFDLVQNVAFYLPYLIGVEIYLARKRYRVAVS